MSEEGIKLCREYLVSHYLPGDAYRYEKHEALCNYYNIDHDVSRNITDNLDTSAAVIFSDRQPTV